MDNSMWAVAAVLIAWALLIVVFAVINHRDRGWTYYTETNTESYYRWSDGVRVIETTFRWCREHEDGRREYHDRKRGWIEA